LFYLQVNGDQGPFFPSEKIFPPPFFPPFLIRNLFWAISPPFFREEEFPFPFFFLPLLSGGVCIGFSVPPPFSRGRDFPFQEVPPLSSARFRTNLRPRLFPLSFHTIFFFFFFLPRNPSSERDIGTLFGRGPLSPSVVAQSRHKVEGAFG